MRVVIIILVVVLLLVGAVVGFVMFAPEDLKSQLPIPLPGIGGNAEPTPEPGVEPPTPTEDPGVEIIVARVDLEAHTYISNTDVLETKNVPTSFFDGDPEQLLQAGRMGDVYEKVLVQGVRAGDPIRLEYLGQPGLGQRVPTPERGRPGPKAYPLRVDNFSGVANQLNVGDTVDVIVTFDVERRIYLPPQEAAASPLTLAPPDQAAAAEGTGETGSGSRSIEVKALKTTKTLVQRAKVLDIVRPPPPPTPVPDPNEAPPEEEAPAEEEETAPVPTPAEENEAQGLLQEGQWYMVVLAVNDQQAELIDFAVSSGARVTLVLRGQGDSAYEATMGATFDLLLSEFGMPMPQPEDPFVFAPEVLTPEPTRTPVATIRIP